MSEGFAAGLQQDDLLQQQQQQQQGGEWSSYTIMDSSRVSTCLISMLLIVYGSFRSLNMEQEQREKEKKRQSESMNNLITGEPVQQEQSMWICEVGRSRLEGNDVFCFGFADKFATLDTMHALCLPLGASISLLVMFFFFDSMQMLFAVCTASKYVVDFTTCNRCTVGFIIRLTIARYKGRRPLEHHKLFFSFRFSHCHRSAGVPPAPHVSVHHSALLGR